MSSPSLLNPPPRRALPAPRHRPLGRLRFSDGARTTVEGRLRILGARAVTTVYRRMLLLAYPLEGVQIPVYHASIPLDFGELEPGAIDAYRAFRPDTTRAAIETRLARGDRCFVSWSGGEIVDACWTATGRVFVPYMSAFLDIPAGDIYSYDSFTRADLRGRGVYMARNSFTARENQGEGFKRSIALVAFENYSAWLVLTRSGLSTLGAYHHVRSPFSGLRWTTAEAGQILPPLLGRR